MSDIREWLHDLGLGQYADAFDENEIGLDLLSRLTDDALEKLGIGIMGHRIRILDAIEARTGDARPQRSRTDMHAAAGESIEFTAPAGERRQLTVMFCDLVGSTALSEKLDPEDLREVIAAYRKCAGEVIKRYDGYVAQYLGDGVMAYFGWPSAHEDDAIRAVRAGLDIVDAVGSLETAAALAVRIGIATGLVVVGDRSADEGVDSTLAVGETPNIAARIQALAEAGTVVIAESTRRLLGGAFALDDLGRRDARGVSHGLHVHRVLGAADAESRFEASQSSASTPLVGRDTEIALLLGRWRQALDREGQVVLLSGEAGMGKSRITQVLCEMTANTAHTRLRYQCSPYYVHSAFSPIISQVEKAAGFSRLDDADARLDKLEAVLARATDDVGAIAPLFAAMLGLPTERYPKLRHSPQKQKDETIAAMAGQIADLSRSEPVLMIFEDAHWADPSSLETLDAVIARIQTAAVLLVITFRPEFEPPWMRHGHVTALTINRLSRRLSANMVASVTGDKPLPDVVLDQIIAKTDGVPLFVEEFTKTVLEAGFLRETADAYLLDGPLPALAVPATLKDSLMARLDRQNIVKDVIQIGAAIGREFSYELLAAISPLDDNELQRSLRELVSTELIFQRSTPPDAVYTFKHALVQNAAYESLLKRRRQDLHERIATTLQSNFVERANTEPELIAHHLTEAGKIEAAIPYWERAGERALQRSANAEAVAHFKKGLALNRSLPDTPARKEQELTLLLALAPALNGTHGYAHPEVAKAFERVRELERALPGFPNRFAVLYGLWLYHGNVPDYAVSREIAEQMATEASRDPDHERTLIGNLVLGVIKGWMGEFSGAKDRLEAVAGLYRDEDHHALTFKYGGLNPRTFALNHAGFACWFLGYPEKALAHCHASRALAHELAHTISLVHSLIMTAWIHLQSRDFENAREFAESARQLAVEARAAYWIAWADVFLGAVNRDAKQLEIGIGALNAAGARISQTSHLGFLAAVHLDNAQVPEAHAMLDQASAAAAGGERFFLSELYRLKGDAVLAEHGPPADAASWFERAIEVARRQQAKSFELRATVSLARMRRQQGNPGEVREMLFGIYDWFSEGFDTEDLQDAKALLEELDRSGRV